MLMALKNTQAIVLAAGKSSRFKTGKTKLLEKICGQEMVVYPASLLVELDIPITFIVGFQKEDVIKTLEDTFPNRLQFIEQEQQLGTGHALACSQKNWKSDHILVLNGDMPLVTKETIEKLYAKHMANNAVISFVTAHNCDPTAAHYGRVVQTDASIAIVEAKEFEGDISENCCINAGIYLMKRSFLEDNLKELQQSEVAKEWYITDLVKIASDKKLGVETISASFDRIRGINTFQELWAAEQIKKAEIIQYWMNNGVRFSIAHNVQIDLPVTIGVGTFIESGVQLLGKTKIGENCVVGPFSILTNAYIGNDVRIHTHTIITHSTVHNNASVGPFAHIREHSEIHEYASVGNFVEIKKSSLGKKTCAKHLTYLGDTKTGERVNIGAGTITCNYNGVKKSATLIEDDVFVGSNNTLVAPVTLKRNSFTAAGSTITQDVPAEALAIARERQTNKEGYAPKLKELQKEPKDDDLQPSFLAALKTSLTDHK